MTTKKKLKTLLVVCPRWTRAQKRSRAKQPKWRVERDRMIFRDHVMDEQSTRSIGHEYGLSDRQVRRIIAAKMMETI